MPTSKNRGFTLVELFASIGVIALSLAICLPAPEHSMAEVGEVDEGPMTVRMYVVEAGGRDLLQIEVEIREAILGTHFEFCGVQLTTQTSGEIEVALWTPASTTPEADLEQLRKVFGDAWNVRLSEAEETLVASNS